MNNKNYYYYYYYYLTLVVDGGARSESHPGHFTPLNVPQYALNMKLGGTQSQAGYYIEE
jgi:hypothetical protein